MGGFLFQVRFVPIRAAFFSGARASFCLHSKPFLLVISASGRLVTLGRLSLLCTFPNVFEQYLLPAAVIEFRSPAVGVAGDSLGRFKSAVIFQKIRDAGSRVALLAIGNRVVISLARGLSLEQSYTLPPFPWASSIESPTSRQAFVLYSA